MSIIIISRSPLPIARPKEVKKDGKMPNNLRGKRRFFYNINNLISCAHFARVQDVFGRSHLCRYLVGYFFPLFLFFFS